MVAWGFDLGVTPPRHDPRVPAGPSLAL